MKIEPHTIVVAVMHTPREKLLGVLDDISAAGISLRGIELGYFDDWCRSIADGEPHLSMSDQFIPMWRVERIARDEPNGDVPSMADEFERKTGKDLREQ